MVTVESHTQMGQMWEEDWLMTKKTEASRKRPTARSSRTWELGLDFRTISRIEDDWGKS